LEYFTLLAKFYLLPPVFLTLALAKDTIDKPAEITSFKFPSSAIPSPFSRTVSYLPARLNYLI